MRHSNNDNGMGALSTLLLGFVAGAVVATFLNADTRRKVKDYTDDLLEKGRDTFDDYKERGQKAVREVSRKATALRDEGMDRLEDGLEQAQDEVRRRRPRR